jgi:hypothetical protein
LDQRAWVGPVEFLKPIDLRADGRPVFVVIITNGGKTPAFKMKTKMTYIPVKKGEIFRPNFPPDSSPRYGVVTLQPGMRMQMLSGPPVKAFDQPGIDSLKSGQIVLYIFGLITYEDVFRIPHQTEFCMMLDRDLTTANACGTFNKAN